MRALPRRLLPDAARRDISPRPLAGLLTSLACALLASTLALHPAHASWSKTGWKLTAPLTNIGVSGDTLFATVEGDSAMYLSTDRGEHWALLPTAPAGVKAFATHGTSVYAATGTGIFRARSAHTWSMLVDLRPYGISAACLLAPSDSLLVCGGDGGLLRSTDGGATWIPSDAALNIASVATLAWTGGTLFAAWSPPRSSERDVYRSADSGASWGSVTTPLEYFYNGKLFACDTLFLPGNPGPLGRRSALYAYDWQSLLVSTDLGASWAPANMGLIDPLTGGSPSVNALTAFGFELYAATTAGLFTSSDGLHWTPVDGSAAFPASPLVAAAGPSLLLLTPGVGLSISTDRGSSWHAGNSGLPAVPSTDTDLRIYGAGTTILAKARGLLFRSTDKGESWTPSHRGLAGRLAGSPLFSLQVVDPVSLDTATCLLTLAGGGLARSFDLGATWSVTFAAPGASLISLTAKRAIAGGWAIFAGTPGGPAWAVHTWELWSSSDLGRSWELRSHFSYDDFFSEGVNSLAADDSMLLLLESRNPYFSLDDGRSWRSPQTSYVYASTVFRLASTFFIGGRYLTSDHGRTWSVIPRDSALQLPVDAGRFQVYGRVRDPAGTPLFRFSLDSMKTWTDLPEALPDSVLSFAVAGPDLYGAAMGGSIWRRPLNELMLSLQASRSVATLPATADTFLVRLTAEGTGALRWSALSRDPWLTLLVSRADSLLVAAAPNLTGRPRTGTLIVGANAWNAPHTITVRQDGLPPGALAVTVQDAEDWGLAGPRARVRLYDPDGRLVDTRLSSTASVALFPSLPADSGYRYTVDYLPDDSSALFGPISWGTKSGITIASGRTTSDLFIRNLPYVPFIRVFNAKTGENLTRRSVPSGTSLRIELLLKNPSYPGAAERPVKARLLLDTSRTLPFEVDLSSLYQVVPAADSSVVSFGYMPHVPGPFYEAGTLLAFVDGKEIRTEGFADFGTPFFTVVPASPGSPTGIDGQPLPKVFALLQNFPNPFNPSTTIPFDLPRAASVSIAVYNNLGEQVALPVSGTLEPGRHQIFFDASALASGVYFYRMRAGEFVQTRRFLVIR